MGYPEKYLPSTDEIKVVEAMHSFFDGLASQGIKWQKYLETATQDETELGTIYRSPDLGWMWGDFTDDLPDEQKLANAPGLVLVRHRTGNFPHRHVYGTSTSRVLQGKGRYVVGMYDWAITPGRTFIVPANLGHYVIVGGNGINYPDDAPAEDDDRVYMVERSNADIESDEAITPEDVILAVAETHGRNLEVPIVMTSLDDFRSWGLKNPRGLWQRYAA